MLRPRLNFLSTACIACSLVVPFVTTTVLPCRSFGAEMVEAFGTISLVPATNIKGENATCLPRSALAVVDPHSMSTLFSKTAWIRSSEVTLTYSIFRLGSSISAPIILHSVDFAPIAQMQNVDDWDGAGRELAAIAASLE